ncbi:MAG: ISAzo13 family transposase, partial [Bryobacterales bacterium]|nr:ISAzo13 family transposase [Bryobacterales bacterium]MCC6364988.1 ISAzo13 family transposase [Bryobacterales bacterium]
VHAQVDDGTYPAGVKVADDEIGSINLQRDVFHGEWNYKILPCSGKFIS